MTLTVPPDMIVLTDFSSDGSCLVGRIPINGVPFHVELVRVRNDEATHQQVVDSKDIVSVEVWDRFCQFQEDEFKTIEVPGHDGEYVMFISPFDK